jgi:hypothetical protein
MRFDTAVLRIFIWRWNLKRQGVDGQMIFRLGDQCRFPQKQRWNTFPPGGFGRISSSGNRIIITFTSSSGRVCHFDEVAGLVEIVTGSVTIKKRQEKVTGFIVCFADDLWGGGVICSLPTAEHSRVNILLLVVRGPFFQIVPEASTSFRLT